MGRALVGNYESCSLDQNALPIDQLSPSRIGVLLSGGLDSAILAGYLLNRGHAVYPIHIRSDVVWRSAEQSAVENFLAALPAAGREPLIVLEMPLRDLYGPHWSVTGQGVPGERTPDEAVYLPGRNALLAVKAAVWCQLHEVPHLALGSLGTSPFADSRVPFVRAFEQVINAGANHNVTLWLPFVGVDKRRVMQLGSGLPLHLTFSCLAPVEGQHCGICNKCAERRAAFSAVDRPDPTPYAQVGSAMA